MELIPLLFYFLIIIPSSIIHEYAHGWVADKLGDPTARYAGRLTVNPIPHIDLWGTIIMPIVLLAASGGTFMFAYAKPVPYNPYNLKNQKWGPALVGLAGPMANLLLAICFTILFRILPLASGRFDELASLVSIIVIANIGLMVFNLLPIPPLDGSKLLYVFLPRSAYNVKVFLERYGWCIRRISCTDSRSVFLTS
jgi:Zn-dependent protease